MSRIASAMTAAFLFFIVTTLPCSAQWLRSQEDELTVYSTQSDDKSISCRVSLLPEGDLIATGIDTNWNGSGKTCYQASYVDRHGHLLKTLIYPEGAPGVFEGYWVFSTHCVHPAAELPKEVRDRFHGTFGIN